MGVEMSLSILMSNARYPNEEVTYIMKLYTKTYEEVFKIILDTSANGVAFVLWDCIRFLQNSQDEQLKKKAKCVLGITASGVSVHGQSALFLFVLC